ncbi:Endoribonuclease Dicer 1 [Thelohanellus kitauei]|uniref:Endoribonuclease Dicer 1 n=1 Tax=Thelohanellus kitauei TaxID=669202 RepID=A0A0C2N559_THEKT|nr:Endoribonuclease Dicer 1 [Thelohanellus kitauei]
MDRFVEYTSGSHDKRSKLPIVSTLTPPFDGMLVCKKYSKDEKIYHVIKAGEVSPEDKIGSVQKTFVEYFKNRGLKLRANEIMLSCYLSRFSIKILRNSSWLTKMYQDLVYFPASKVVAHPLSFSTLFQIRFFPYIIKQLVDYLVLEEWCRNNIDVNLIDQIDFYSIESLDHSLQKSHVLDELKESHFDSGENMFEDYYLALSQYWDTSSVNSQKMLLQSLFQTFAESPHDSYYNYQRMEFLGDCILKFIVSLVLFVSYSNDHTSTALKKSSLLSNAFFAQLGKHLQVEKFMNANPIYFGKNWCPPGFVVEKDDLDVMQDDLVTHQCISPKPIANAVNSLIGYILISSNISLVYEFLLKLIIHENDGIFKKLRTLNQLTKEFEGLVFDYPNIESIKNDICSVEKIIKYNFTNKNIISQALTYVSINGQIRLSRERLSFLGSSIVRFIVVFYLYLSHTYLKTKCLPPSIITLLRDSLLNSKSLGIISAKSSLLKCIQADLPIQKNLSHFMNCVENLEELTEIHEVPFLGLIKTPRINQDTTDTCPTIEVIHIPKVAADVLESIMGAVFVDSKCDLVLTAKIFLPFFKPYIRKIENFILEKYLKTFPIQPKMHFMENFSHYEKNFIEMENMRFKHIITDPNTSKQYAGIGFTQDEAFTASCYSLIKYRRK